MASPGICSKSGTLLNFGLRRFLCLGPFEIFKATTNHEFGAQFPVNWIWGTIWSTVAQHCSTTADFVSYVRTYILTIWSIYWKKNNPREGGTCTSVPMVATPLRKHKSRQHQHYPTNHAYRHTWAQQAQQCDSPPQAVSCRRQRYAPVGAGLH